MFFPWLGLPDKRREYAVAGSVITMKRSSVYLAAGLLLAAVAIKLAFPAKTKDTIQAVRTVTVPVTSAEKTILNENAEPAAAPEAMTVTVNAAEYLGREMPAAAAQELPEAVEQAVETFLETQAPYEELGIPANVSYNVPQPYFPFVAPVKARVSSSFGYRVHPLENLTKFHYGTDLAALSGDDILCFAEGTVTEIGMDEEHGNYIRVQHPDGFESMYAHCGTVYVRQGQKVSAGEKIGLVGVSGMVTGPHLHFELTKDGQYLNPEFYMAAL